MQCNHRRSARCISKELVIEDLDQIWQTAFEINDFYLRSFLMVYSAALPCHEFNNGKHTAIGAWLENVINSADEYTYNFYSELLMENRI